MKVVQPIRDKELIKDVAEYLKNRNERDYVLFAMGIYTGLRISDLLKIRVRDVQGVEHLVVTERKTGKSKRVKLSPTVREIINDYLANREPERYEFLFKSRNRKNRPISRERAYAILREAAEAFDMKSIGCHSMRKTFGYHVYKNTKNVALLQDMFNHSAPEITLRYIGVNQDTHDKAIDSLDFF